MSGAGFQLIAKIDDREIQRALQALVRKGDNLRPALKNMGQHLMNSTKDRFEAQQDPDGSPWAPLRDATKKRKRINKILTESSRLKDSIVPQVIGNNTLRVGTNVIYAAAHQFGLKGSVQVKAHKSRRTQVFGKQLPFPVWASVRAHAMNQNIPARPFLGLSSADREEILAIAADFLAMSR